MVHTRTFVRGALWSGGSVFASMAAVLLCAKMFTNTLTGEEVGVFVLLLLSADTLNLASSLGLQVSLPKLVAAASPESRSGVAAAALGGQLMVGLTLSLLVFAARPLIEAFAGFTESTALHTLSDHAWLVPPLYLTGLLRDLCMASLAGLNRYAARGAGILAASFLQVLLIYVFVWRTEGGVTALTLATALSYAIALVWLFAALPRGGRLAFHPAQFMDLVRFSVPLYLNSLLTFVYQRMDTALVTAMLGVPAAGIYEMMKRAPMLLSRSLGALLVPYLPGISALAAAGKQEHAARLVHETLTLTAFAGFSGALLATALQEPLVLFLFSADYLEGLPALGLLLAAMCLMVQAGVAGQTLIAHNRPGAVTLVNVAVVLVSLGLNALLLPRLGLRGAGIAACTAGAVSFWAQALMVHRWSIPIRLVSHLKLQGAMGFCLLILVFSRGSIPRDLAVVALFVALSLLMKTLTVTHLRALLSALNPTEKDSAQ